MALLWWIGTTANGNVNVASNWSYFGPASYPAGSTMLVPATNIPKYNDTITFDRFVIGATVYPLFSPIGDMNGICGPAGATAAQYFQEVRVNPAYPKTIGGTTAFGFRTSSLVIKRGITASLPNNYTNTHYFYLRDCSGVTKENARIILDSQIKETYVISGVAAQIKIGPQFGSPLGRDPHSIIQLPNLEIQGRTFDASVDTTGRLNAAIYGIESSVTYANQMDQIAQVNIVVYPTTTIGNNVYLEGREKLTVYRGFNLASHGLYLTSSLNQSPDTTSPSYAQVEFITDSSASLTGTGPDISNRSYIYEMYMEGESTTTPSFEYLATLPKAILDHGVDINQLYFRGTGQVTTNNPQIGDAARILRGRFNFAKASNPFPAPQDDDATVVRKMGFYSDVDNISFGSAGTFVWENIPTVYDQLPNYLRANLRGTWAYKITPIVQ